jgi:hypothetical protein
MQHEGIVMLSPPSGRIASANYLVSKQSLASVTRKKTDYVIDGISPRVEAEHMKIALD